MPKQLENLSFEQWLAYVFDHPIEEHKNAWYWDIDRDWWNETPAETIQFLTQAFENAAEVLEPYSDAQLNQGMWFMQIIPAPTICLPSWTKVLRGPRKSAVFTQFLSFTSNASPNAIHPI
jgi:hypothetical protein